MIDRSASVVVVSSSSKTRKIFATIESASILRWPTRGRSRQNEKSCSIDTPFLWPPAIATASPIHLFVSLRSAPQKPFTGSSAAVAVTGCHHHRRHPCTPSALQRVSSHVVASGALAAVGVSSGGHPNTQTWANTSCQQYMYAYRVLYDVKKINFRHTYGAY